MRAVIAGRRAGQLEPCRPIEDPQDDDVREAFDVGEPCFEFRENLQRALGFVFRTEPPGNLACLLVGSPDETNGLRCEHLHESTPRLTLCTLCTKLER